jgi:starch synthase
MPYDTAWNLSNKTRILFVASEIYPLAKTGGLADVCGALPKFVAEDGSMDFLLMLPGYQSVLDTLDHQFVVAALDDLPGGSARLILGTLPDSELRVIVLDQPDLYGRSGIYTNEDGESWPDNAVRFAALCHAAVRVACGQVWPGWRADIVHCHDWHTGLIPLLISAVSGKRPKTLLTIHNLAFQGNFPIEEAAALDLPANRVRPEDIEFYGQISFLKAGILYADRVTTVSPSYAKEIVKSEFGMGFDGVLAQRKRDLVGILNGIDEELWNPESDAMIPACYSVDDRGDKAECKAALQRDWGLNVDPAAPLVVFVARIELQKMADVMLDILPDLMERPDLQLAVLGAGAPKLEEALAAWPARAPGRVAVRIGYAEEAAHQLLAGGDMLLHGARFEPCGLTPIYAMRYGTIPLVTKVGGLRDTTTDASTENLADGIANAVQFSEPTAEAMLSAVDYAIALYSERQVWEQMQTNAMNVDFSWHEPAARYRDLYQVLTEATV